MTEFLTATTLKVAGLFLLSAAILLVPDLGRGRGGQLRWTPRDHCRHPWR